MKATSYKIADAGPGETGSSSTLSEDDLTLEPRKGHKPIFDSKGDLQARVKNVGMGERVPISHDAFFDWINALAEAAIAPVSVNARGGDDSPCIPDRFYFRGEPSARYQLLPSLLRSGVYDVLCHPHGADHPIALQRRLLDRYKRYTQHLIHSDGDFKSALYRDFDTLCLAQHHGLPTLLLDWSLNAYVAAYFALSEITPTILTEYIASNQNATTYVARVWVMRLRSSKERRAATIHLEDRYAKWDDVLSGDVPPPFPKIVVPLVFTRRIASQVGRFVYCGFMAKKMLPNPKMRPISMTKYSVDKCAGATKPEEIESIPADELPWSQLYSLDITFDIGNQVAVPSGKQGKSDEIERRRKLFQAEINKAMRRLEFMGFHAGRLFPDLEGWAQYLREGNL